MTKFPFSEMAVSDLVGPGWVLCCAVLSNSPLSVRDVGSAAHILAFFQIQRPRCLKSNTSFIRLYIR